MQNHELESECLGDTLGESASLLFEEALALQWLQVSDTPSPFPTTIAGLQSTLSSRSKGSTWVSRDHSDGYHQGLWMLRMSTYWAKSQSLEWQIWVARSCEGPGGIQPGGSWIQAWNCCLVHCQSLDFQPFNECCGLISKVPWRLCLKAHSGTIGRWKEVFRDGGCPGEIPAPLCFL